MYYPSWIHKDLYEQKSEWGRHTARTRGSVVVLVCSLYIVTGEKKKEEKKKEVLGDLFFRHISSPLGLDLT